MQRSLPPPPVAAAAGWFAVTAAFTAFWLTLNYIYPALSPTGIPTAIFRTLIHTAILIGLWQGLARTDFSANERLASGSPSPCRSRPGSLPYGRSRCREPSCSRCGGLSRIGGIILSLGCRHSRSTPSAVRLATRRLAVWAAGAAAALLRDRPGAARIGRSRAITQAPRAASSTDAGRPYALMMMMSWRFAMTATATVDPVLASNRGCVRLTSAMLGFLAGVFVSRARVIVAAAGRPSPRAGERQPDAAADHEQAGDARQHALAMRAR